MNGKKAAETLLKAFAAGLFISCGGAVFLSCESRYLGALLFAVGLFVICTQGLLLFTGKVCYVFENDLGYALGLVLIWIGNLAGCAATASLLRMTRIAGIAEKAAGMCDTKLAETPLSIFILGIFCNIMIWVAVEGYKKNPHELGKYLAIVFGVVVFIVSGFEHCVANMFYFAMAGQLNGLAFTFLLINTLGNAVGGVLMPLLLKACGKLA